MTGQELRYWKEAIGKEEKLRLKWFDKNESRLMDCLKERNAPAVTDKDRQELTESRKILFATSEKYPKIRTDDPPNSCEDQGWLINAMKPVLPEHTDLIYNSSNKGRVTYLKEREHILPEDRYYFPETTSFNYGWKMWNCAKTMEGSKFGKMAVVRQSFYRRRAGIERDADWYITPSKLSPTICNCN